MAFLDPAEGNRYFGNQQFHLKRVKTTPADPGRGYVPAYHFEMVADGMVVGRCNLRVGQGENIRISHSLAAGWMIFMGPVSIRTQEKSGMPRSFPFPSQVFLADTPSWGKICPWNLPEC